MAHNGPTSRAERETILRWDEEERRLHVYTASPTMERRWRLRGIALRRVGPGWSGTAPLACLRPLRAVGADGEVVRRAPGRLQGVAAKRKGLA